MISFIMMAKNVEQFIGSAIRALQDSTHEDWELIVVDDGSTDDTFEVVKHFSKSDERIILFRNPFIGKVKGTSFGFTKASGDIIKCIDSDDIVAPEIFDFLSNHRDHDVLFHSALVVDSDLNPITEYHPNLNWLASDYNSVAQSLISLPKWSWSFNREIADIIFPLPEELPFEDVWFSFICKKHAVNPHFSRKPLYLYRQHANQTFGGILNFSRTAIEFRANRLLALIAVLEGQKRIEIDGRTPDFYLAKVENRYLSRRCNFFNLVAANPSIKRCFLLVISRWCPRILQPLAIIKWKFEAFRKT